METATGEAAAGDRARHRGVNASCSRESTGFQGMSNGRNGSPRGGNGLHLCPRVEAHGQPDPTRGHGTSQAGTF